MKKIVSFTAAFLMAAMAFAAGQQGAAGGGASQAPSWPTKTIQVYIPWGAGGDTDLHGRVLSELIGKELGATIVCSNMPGTGGTVAARQVLNSPKDGYTVLWSQTSFLISSALGIADFSYKDLETVATVIEDESNLFVINKKVGKFKDVRDYANYGKANPGGIKDGIEVGADSHLLSLFLGDALDIQLTRVDVGGTSTKIPILLNGDIDSTHAAYGTFKSYIDSGDFAPLVMLGTKRLSQFPDVPTLKEASGKDFSYTKLFGYWMPPGTDQAIVDKFAEAAKKAVNSDAFKEHCAKYYINPAAKTGSEAKSYLDKQYSDILKYKDAMVVK
jgi:tripartite-type tricarboxylate transporter receptor subunit TctC